MKPIVCLIIGVTMCFSSFSQFQELEQLRLNLEKLVQFKLILSEMKSGYQTLQNGYNSVRDAGKANFNLHQDFLDELLKISPQLKSNPAITRTYSGQQELIVEYKQLLLRLKSSGVFTVTELYEVVNSCNGLVDVVNADTELLATVLSPGKFRMSDGERTTIIETVEQSVRKQLGKLKSISQDYNKLMALRVQQRKDVETLKRLGRQ